ncbi:ATP-binding protein [Coxiella burnetii]|uniref:ATP-binding protein n=1 Tax=Coxiella burnetii TaxID=777 RepID=UPI00222EC31B|nr:ATP-binding protein [Coxiella burnetii]
MDPRFSSYNAHLLAPNNLWEADSHLRLLKGQPYIYHSPMIQDLPRTIPGIYTIGGGRQIGKTTLLKQWIAALIAEKVDPQAIIFFTGELIDDHHVLVDLLQTFISQHQSQPRLYIIIDEITYVENWDRGIKFLADAGYFHNCIVLLTGSDLTLMQQARMTFPGRRGRADKVDYHLYPLSFKEFLQLKNTIPNLNSHLTSAIPSDEILHLIYREFNYYLIHGGYLTAINDIARNGKIALSTLKTYSDWIRGDVLKRGKQESYLKEIITAIIKRYNKQVTWHAIADALSIDSHKTVAGYCELLSRMDALFIQSALLLDKLTAAPKKARKLTFTDPFIFHALKQWVLPPEGNPHEQIVKDTEDSIISSSLMEAIVSNQYRRYYPTYYIKCEGEIDVAYVHKNAVWPIEIKWRNQLRPHDLKQIKKYKRARIFSKTNVLTRIDSIPIEPLPLALLKDDRDHPLA